MHVKNCTSAYISPATFGVILAILRWEPGPGRESLSLFLPFRLSHALSLFHPEYFFFDEALTEDTLR